MRGGESARRLLEELGGEGGTVAEVLIKQGRSRRSELGVQGLVSVVTAESGWAVRAGGKQGSFFACGTGEVPLGAHWPTPTGPPLTLPEPQRAAPWQPGAEVEAPLAIEGEARGIIEGIGRELGRELEGAGLLRAVLDDGLSESAIVSTRGLDSGFRSRQAMLYLEAVHGSNPATRTRLEIAAPEARAFAPKALARRLADCLVVRGGEAGPRRERGEMVLAPPVGAELLSALRPLWLGPDAAARAARLTDRGNRLASSVVTVVDDPRFAGGGLAAPIDGEGVPTRRVVLVDQGRYRHPLRDWRESAADGRRPAGCIRRPSWRDRPRLGLSHLYLEPDAEVSATELVGSVPRGFYLLDTLGAPRIDFEADRFAVPVCGFGLLHGQATTTVGRAWLCGGISALLRGVRAVARDLTFLPKDALVGAPSLLVAGLELRGDLG